MSDSSNNSEQSNQHDVPLAQGWRALLPLLIAAVLAWIAMHLLFVGTNTRFDELALGQETIVYTGTFDNSVIHCIGLVEGEKCFAAVQQRAMPAGVVLWLGNSQLHAINQYKPGDEAAGWWLHQALIPRGEDLTTLSLPNANLQEHYLVTEYARQRIPVHTLIVPAVFDDMRETGIRALAEAPLTDPALRPVLQATTTGSRLLQEYAGAQRQEAGNDIATGELTLQQRSESALENWSIEHSSVWAARAEARGEIMTELYLLRNSLLGINAQTKRPLIASSYQYNMQALRDLLLLHQRADIRVLVYIAPLRSDIAPPYVPEEYEQFKQDVRQLAADTGVEFADFGDVVPGEYWGTKAAATNLGGEPEYDFMHFQGPGHQLLAAAVLRALEMQPPQ